jgi:uncharacterized sulfatase
MGGYDTLPFMSGIQTRRQFLAFGAVAGSAFSAACALKKTEEPKRPNILFILGDDWSYPHAGAYGDAAVKTPAFDRIAREGVLFTHSFTASPSCTPSRSAILSGRPIYKCKEAGVLYGSLPKDLPLFSHALEDAGYFVGHTGKGWLPGNPTALGMDRPPLGKPFQSKRHPGGVREGLDPRDYAANFADFLAERPKEKPFFFWLGGAEPHRAYAKGAGLQLGKKLTDAKVPKPWPDVAEIQSDILDYYSEVEWLDQQVAKALDVLEKTGEMDNTLIVMTSDNGMPFPRAKVNLYDAGTRMPLAIRWGAKIPPGRTVDDFVSHTDFAATFLEVAGLPKLPGSTGKSLIPLLTSTKSGILDESRDHVVTALERHTMCRPDGATYPMRALRTRDFLYIRNFEPDRWPTGGPDFISSNKTTHGDVDACPTKDFFLDPANQQTYKVQYELGFGKRPGEELYDVRSDPDQVNNLAASEASLATLARYRDRLSTILRGDGDPRIEGQDPWQAYIYHQTTGYGASMNLSLSKEEREKAAGVGPHKPE